MLPAPAKSSETRAILLLISGHTEHLWIQMMEEANPARCDASPAGPNSRRGIVAPYAGRIVLIGKRSAVPRPTSSCHQSISRLRFIVAIVDCLIASAIATALQGVHQR